MFRVGCEFTMASLSSPSSEHDVEGQVCQSFDEMNLKSSDSLLLPGASIDQAENSVATTGCDEVQEEDDTCYELIWKEMEEGLNVRKDAQDMKQNDDKEGGAEEDGSTIEQSATSLIMAQEERIVEKFQMPVLKTFHADLFSTRANKIVTVYPLKEDHLNLPEILQIKSSEHCLEYRVRYIRHHEEIERGSCFLSLYFTSKTSAEAAVAKLKVVLPDREVEFLTQESQANKVMTTWSNNQKPNHLLPTCTLLIKNIGSTITVDKLKDLIPGNPEDVVLPREKQDGKGALRNKGYAYAVYLSGESADEALESCAKAKLDLDGRTLKVMKYFEPISKPEGLLSLVERRLVLKQGSKASSMIEKKKKGEEVKSYESWLKKLQVCLKVMEKDNELRRELSLPLPSSDDLANMKDLPMPDSKKSQQIMERLGIFFARSMDKTSSSASASYKTAAAASTAAATAAAAGSKNAKGQKSWYQEKRNKRSLHRSGMGRGILNAPCVMPGNMGLLGNGPMLQNMYGQHGGPYNSGYGRFNYKGQYRGYPGNQRDLASSVGLLVNLSQMLAQQVQNQQQHPQHQQQQQQPQFGQQRGGGGGGGGNVHGQNMYAHGDYNRGAGSKFGQPGTDRGASSGGHYDGFNSSGGHTGQYQNRPFYSGHY